MRLNTVPINPIILKIGYTFNIKRRRVIILKFMGENYNQPKIN